jgi:hypothetical protein
MLPASWKPVAVGPLVRVGAAHDGGYVLAEAALKETSLLLSMGLSDDWSFEEDFHARTGARILCFDGSVTRRFWIKHAILNLLHRRPRRALRFAAYRRFFARRGVEHRQQMIGYDGPGSVSLDTLMAELQGERIFLKCDIEGWEYRIFDQIARHAARFTGIAMELHDVDLHRDRISALLERLIDFRVVDLHANNFCPADPGGDPMVLEISLVRADLVPAGATQAPPLAAPCDPTRPELPVVYEPGEQQRQVA